MTDPLNLAEAIDKHLHTIESDSGLLFGWPQETCAMISAALRLAHTVDQAEARRRERTSVEHHGMDRDEAEMLDAFRKARDA